MQIANLNHLILIYKLLTKQETQLSAIANGAHSSETFFSGVIENQPIISGYSGILQSLKGSTDPHLNALSKHLNSASGDIGWHKTEKHGGKTREGLLLPSMLVPEKKRTRTIGSKSKRLLIDGQDALELRLTWEEAQSLLRPPPSIKPVIDVIEDYEFEAYTVRKFSTVLKIVNELTFIQCLPVSSHFLSIQMPLANFCLKT